MAILQRLRYGKHTGWLTAERWASKIQTCSRVCILFAARPSPDSRQAWLVRDAECFRSGETRSKPHDDLFSLDVEVRLCKDKSKFQVDETVDAQKQSRSLCPSETWPTAGPCQKTRFARAKSLCCHTPTHHASNPFSPTRPPEAGPFTVLRILQYRFWPAVFPEKGDG
jgi:hypothetical protein